MSEELVEYLRKQKTDDPDASVPEILRRAKEKNLIAAGVQVHRATAWRAVKRLGLATTSRVAKRLTDMRRYAYPHRMRMVLVDGKHFRAGRARRKRVAFFFIDDCTRRVLWVVVAASENSRLLLRGLYQVIRHFGLMDILYCSGLSTMTTTVGEVDVCLRMHIQSSMTHGPPRHSTESGHVKAGSLDPDATQA